MKKRLFAAFLMVGAISAVMVMSASAFWTTGQATLNVNAQAGEASLLLPGCDLGAGANCSATHTISQKIVPGWSQTSPAIPVKNDGDVPLELIFSTGGVDNLLDEALVMSISCNGNTIANTLGAWTGGVSFGTLAPNATSSCTGTLSLPADASNDLQGKTASFSVNLYGKTN